MDSILIVGLWLEGSAWADVTAQLERQGHGVTSPTLPGQRDGAPAATLENQLAAVVAAVDAQPTRWSSGIRRHAVWRDAR